MEEQTHITSVSVAEELARKDQQLESLRQAYLDLQQQTHQLQQQHQIQDNGKRENIFKMINHMPTFTGTGEVTVNSFFSSIEYLLSTIQEESLKKEAVRTIFYKVIQGQAKDVIINIPTPDNWQLIKKLLKLRYRPDTEPHQIYKKINNLCVRTVSELAIEIQNIKYKTDELVIYHRDDHGIDLSNIDSILINTIKEMSQGTLLDKIYDMRDLGNILDIMTRRRYEDSCIRPEYRKFKGNDDRIFRQNRPQNKNNNNNQGHYQRNYVGQSYFRQNNEQARNNNNNNDNYNNSGRYRFQNDARNNNTPRHFQGVPQVGHARPYSNQVRWQPPRQNRTEPMEVDNIERCYNNPRVAGHPNHKFGQDRLNLGRQSPEGPEINNTIFFTRQPLNACQR